MIPYELQRYLSTYGASKLIGGYLELLDASRRKTFSELIKPVAEKYGTLEVFALTAFADVLAWDGQYVYMLRLSEGRGNVILSGFTFFFSNINDPDYEAEYFDLNLFEQAKEALGTLQEGECYAFEPLPILGGDRTVDTVRKEKVESYIQFLVSIL